MTSRWSLQHSGRSKHKVAQCESVSSVHVNDKFSDKSDGDGAGSTPHCDKSPGVQSEEECDTGYTRFVPILLLRYTWHTFTERSSVAHAIDTSHKSSLPRECR